MKHPPPSRRILLADCDCFFVQVAQLEDPRGLGCLERVIVGGRAEGRGVVTSASYGARAFGVRSAMPTAHALRLCPDATVVPVPREACSRRSREVRGALERWAPVVEAASIDEFFLDLSGTERLYAGEALAQTAARIQEAVREETGIRISLGGGSQRTVAKLATRLAKPNGVHVVPAGEEAEWMLRWQVADLPSAGPAFVQALERRGIRTVAEARALDRRTLELWLGARRGGWLWERVRGIDPTPVEVRAAAQSLGHERTFATDLHGDDEVRAELLRLVVEVGAGLRDRGRRARTVTVRLRDADRRDRQHSRTLPEGVESDRAIGDAARELLDRLRAERRTGVRLLGVALSRFGPAGGAEQPGLFAAGGESERDQSLSRALDRVRARWGKEALLPARIVGTGGGGTG
ncbi:MAG: DNA polymerase IV [Gemmatimonadota bacterium]|jgi:DNA polymerase-4|nr:DNA polymerase IV [Gemmatimonadota bacterium]